MLNYVEVLAQLEELFQKRFSKDARFEAESLLADYLNISKPQLYLNKKSTLDSAAWGELKTMAARRNQGEPLQYILGWAEFLGLRFSVNSNVLIPRLDSESMVMAGVEALRKMGAKNPRVLDLGAGSGALGMAVLHLIPSAQLVSVDTSHEALNVLKKNGERLGFNERMTLLELDLDKESSFVQLAHLNSEYDLILANPPYIDPADPDLDDQVKTYEPGLALFASELGLEKIINWSQKTTDLLSSKGIYLCEMGWKQGPKVKNWFTQNLSRDFVFELHKDLSGHDRYFSLRRA